jgi:rare lipoprotein A (peptidoglycan hydrolase)
VSRRVKLVLRGPDGGVLRTATEARGSFRTRISPDLAGNYAVRAYVAHGARTRAGASPARRLTAYRQAGASYYGPGLYGNGVACGGTLLPGTLGVANKTLPCGTRVKLRYRGRTVTVPVIDRGPYVAGRDYDLTTATKLRLGFPGVGTVQANR